MRRTPDHKILQSVNDLVAAVTQLVSNVAATAGAVPRATGGAPRATGGRRAAAGARAPAAGPQEKQEKTKRLRSAIRAHWASMSPTERAERVRRMLAGRGLKPLSARKPVKVSAKQGAKSARLRTAVRAHWASLTPEERAARVKRMLAGRGLKPKA